MSEIIELSHEDILNSSHRFRCAFDCINISISESMKICNQIGKKVNYPLYDEASFIDEVCSRQNNRILVICDGDNCYGALHFELCKEGDTKVVYIHHVGVYPQYRRKCYATELFRYLFKYVRADEYQIGLMADNLSARKFYESLGFRTHSLFMFRNKGSK